LKIALLAPPYLSVPPKAYGGTEKIVSLLAEGLVDLGHDVTLFASGDSQTRAKLISIFPEELGNSGLSKSNPLMPMLHFRECFLRAGEFDLIHNHAQYMPMFFSEYVKTPVVHTMHGSFYPGEVPEEKRQVLMAFKKQPFISISNNQRKVLPDLKFIDEAIEIGERGLREADSDWRIPYYLATTYHIYKHDRTNAIKYFDIAIRTANVPDSVKRIALNYGAVSDIRQQTKQIWISIYETSGDEIVRERARLYILHYEYIELLERASNIYKQKTGDYPDSLDKLVSGRILKEIPKDPFGFEYMIDSRGRVSIKIN